MKNLALVVAIVLVFTLAGCGDKEGSNLPVSPAPTTQPSSSNGQRVGTPGGPTVNVAPPDAPSDHTGRPGTGPTNG